jgi:hypothetical protein
MGQDLVMTDKAILFLNCQAIAAYHLAKMEREFLTGNARLLLVVSAGQVDNAPATSTAATITSTDRAGRHRVTKTVSKSRVT